MNATDKNNFDLLMQLAVGIGIATTHELMVEYCRAHDVIDGPWKRGIRKQYTLVDRLSEKAAQMDTSGTIGALRVKAWTDAVRDYKCLTTLKNSEMREQIATAMERRFQMATNLF